MPDTTVLEITPRMELRKQNRALRARGGVPAVIYGHRVDPVPVTLPRREFERAFHKVGRTQLLDLKIDGIDEETFYRLGNLGYEEYSVLSMLENEANHEREHAAQITKTLVS